MSGILTQLEELFSDYRILCAALCVVSLSLLAFLKLMKRKQIASTQQTHAQKQEEFSKQTSPENPSKHNISFKHKKQVQKPSFDKAEIKTPKQLQQFYSDEYYGSIGLKPSNAYYSIKCVAVGMSKILMANSKNQLILFDLKKLKKNGHLKDRNFTQLDNNNASALAIGNNYYYVALDFDRTIAYYSFKGEEGVYFQLVFKFPRNVLKSQACSLHVPKSENYIISSGSQADTTVDVWSMKGEKLHNFNTYQVKHYSILYGADIISILGWTSQIKLCKIYEDKGQTFGRLEKLQPLPHKEKPHLLSIDNLGLNALTVSKEMQVFIWKILPAGNQNKLKRSNHQLNLNEIQACLLHTVKDENDRYRTLIAIADCSRVLIFNGDLQKIWEIEGIEVAQLDAISTGKKCILTTITKGHKLLVWNLSDVVGKIREFTLE